MNVDTIQARECKKMKRERKEEESKRGEGKIEEKKE